MSKRSPIKVLVADDSALFRELLKRGLDRDPAIEVVATAADPYEARDRIIQHRPQVMTLDIEMPRMNGIDFLKKLMPQYPLPTVVVSSVTDRVFDALGAGAVDFVEKPACGGRTEAFINEVIVKVKIASTARVGHHKRAERFEHAPWALERMKRRVIAIGASTGGTKAIQTILQQFPVSAPGIVIAQHMPPVFTRLYAERLNNLCRLEVKEAEEGDRVLPGRAIIAPGGHHLRVVRKKDGFAIEMEAETADNKVNGHCPSVDVLFHSLAESAGRRAVGVLLTGMGRDGAEGLLAMRKAGARTLGQDEATSVVYGMPKAAWELGAVERQIPLEKIHEALLDLLRDDREAGR